MKIAEERARLFFHTLSYTYAVIKKDSLLGIIDFEGEVRADFEYQEIHTFLNLGYFLTKNDYIIFTLDENGNLQKSGAFGVEELPFAFFYWSNGLHFLYEQDEAYSKQITIPQEAIPVKKSTQIIEESADWSSWENLAPPYAIYKDKKLVTDFEFEKCGASSEGLMTVYQNGKWGYIDENGEIVIPIEYDASWNEHDMKDLRTGKWVKEEFCYAASDGYVPLRKGDSWELRDIEGNLVISPGIFEKICPVYQEKCWVKKDGKWGVIRLGAVAETSGEAEKETATITSEEALEQTRRGNSIGNILNGGNVAS